MRQYKRVIAALAVAALSACAHGGIVPASSTQSSTQMLAQVGTLSIVTTGNFTEYSLPTGRKPVDLTRGPYGTIWFTGGGGNGNGTLNYLTISTGVVHTVSVPSPYATGPDVITSTSRAVWFRAFDTTPQFETPAFISGVTPEHTFSFFGTGSSDEFTTNLAVGPDGNIWSGECIETCGDAPDSAIVGSTPITGGNGHGVRLDNFMNANGITPGPGGLLYAAATNDLEGAAPTFESAVLVISTAPAILRKLELPPTSNPVGIVTGSDHNLWVTETAINKIARVTPTGTVTQFSIPTANAGASHITYGQAGSLWFTETNANKIGRITTTGSVTEYRIPTVSSGPSGITPCTTSCGVHGGVWFTETNANKIGRFNSPI
jgi:streptogramin lyase